MNNQKIMVLAIAGALTAPGLAMAQSANVSLYGSMDVRFDQSKYSDATNIGTNTPKGLTKQHLSGGTPNYIGFRGSEDLGGGLSAFFQVESQIFTDARPDVSSAAHTNALFGGRPTYLGLRSTSWGELSGGYQDSPYKDVQKVWNVGVGAGYGGVLMGNGNSTGAVPSPNCAAGFASGTNVLNATAATTTAAASTNCSENPGNSTSFNRTMSDSLVFRSAAVNGFRVGTMITIKEFKEGTTQTAVSNTSSNPGMMALSGTWSGGPFSAAAGYEKHEGFRGAGAAGTTLTGQNTASTANRMAKDTAWSMGGKYNYGKGNVALGYETLSYGNAGTSAVDNGFKTKTWVVTADYAVSAAGRAYAGYAKNNGRTSCGSAFTVAATTATALATCGSDLGAKQYSFGYDHSLSKRTKMYAYYANIKNNAAATFGYASDSRTTNAASTTSGAVLTNNTGSASSAITAGVSQSSINLGMAHTF